MSKFDIALKKYVDIFADQEMYFVNDIKNTELFHNLPLNTNADDIRTKLSALNDAELSNKGLLEDAIKHLIHLKVDARINSGDLSVVEDIANMNANGKSHQMLHFASAYCNLHRPDVFPIYSEQHFDFYRKYILQNKLSLDPEKINTYPVFCQALNHLVEKLGLKGKMNYLQLRKFAWLYAESILKESGE